MVPVESRSKRRTEFSEETFSEYCNSYDVSHWDHSFSSFIIGEWRDQRKEEEALLIIPTIFCCHMTGQSGDDKDDDRISNPINEQGLKEAGRGEKRFERRGGDVWRSDGDGEDLMAGGDEAWLDQFGDQEKLFRKNTLLWWVLQNEQQQHPVLNETDLKAVHPQNGDNNWNVQKQESSWSAAGINEVLVEQNISPRPKEKERKSEMRFPGFDRKKGTMLSMAADTTTRIKLSLFTDSSILLCFLLPFFFLASLWWLPSA